MQTRFPRQNKRSLMHEMLKSRPGDWFRGSDMSLRDQELLRSPNNMFSYDKGCFVRQIVYKQAALPFTTLEWVVEHDHLCKKRIHEAGGALVGFPETAMPSSVSPPYQSMIVNVNVKGAPGGLFDWGYLSTSSQNVRIFRGPESTCSAHPWDAMILKDCYANTSNLRDIEAICDRRWDILAMKMCEDVEVCPRDLHKICRFNLTKSHVDNRDTFATTGPVGAQHRCMGSPSEVGTMCIESNLRGS
ncbi:hypothetical protein MCOR25_006476 [Pyricularia grisea]|uniref:Uncharacterized protein n=1 Tax=Pyricularia grisea TaxID=148305 RepID=A0A6P8AND2_PYRGI|nr:uncharacterized protein PgNI_11548 [Pyricularia grisea]KAI6361571.1 hypothetical protein MCOR25_006476 [Pyricularia grisea]TLD03530.1 hypothetical protein PgNI_11548 [Pyricularia grisea]